MRYSQPLFSALYIVYDAEEDMQAYTDSVAKTLCQETDDCCLHFTAKSVGN